MKENERPNVILSAFNKSFGKTIVLPEAEYSTRILKAGLICAKQNICNIILLAKNPNNLKAYNKKENVQIVDMKDKNLVEQLANALYQKRQSKGITLEDARLLVTDPIYFGTMMVDVGLADGMVSGAETTTAASLRPGLQIIKGRNGSIVSSFMIMSKQNKITYILSDCGINPNPSAEDLSQIAYQTFNSARDVCNFKDSKMAFLSYSTLGSGKGESPDKSRQACNLLHDKFPYIVADGELQFDAAIDKSVASLKAPTSTVAGNANILIFPDLQSGNIGYKIMERLAGFSAIGPICQGFNKPINDVSRGASIEEIANVIAVTAKQAKLLK